MTTAMILKLAWRWGPTLALTIALLIAGLCLKNEHKVRLKREGTIHDQSITIGSLEQTVRDRDQQLTDVGKTGSIDYANLAAQCSSNSSVWFDRGVAVGRALCVPNSIGGQSPAADTNHPAPVR